MQYLKITQSTTLSDIAAAVGSRNVDMMLAKNDISRTPNIGKEFDRKCQEIISSYPNVDWQRKTSLLNTFTKDNELFEEASLLSENGWKILSKLGTFPNALSVPETVQLPLSNNVMGGSSVGVPKALYYDVMHSLKNSHEIDTSIFNKYAAETIEISEGAATRKLSSSNTYNMFNLPWGKIQLYSSLADETIDFPVYPEEFADSRKANYTQMPDTLYQYEPWYLYESSGPRDVEYTFHFHRDMWSGDHNDGKANELIRFCEACCYPRYQGSSVVSPTVRLYINGKLSISGIMVNVSTKWSGPLGHDGWYLECELTLTITEVSDKPLNFDRVRQSSIIGD